MPEVMRAYKDILGRSKRQILLGTIGSLASWDMETMMPPKSSLLRSEQMALLSQIGHKMGTDPEIGKLLRILEKDDAKLGAIQRRNVELIRKSYDEETALPEKLVEQIARQQVISVNAWKKAKSKKDYSMFRPELAKMIELNRESAEILMGVKKTRTPYDALIDIFEPKMTSLDISKVFGALASRLKILISKIEGTHATGRVDVPIEKQRDITKLLANALGFDAYSKDASSRIDETEHPFTTGYYDDVRITTHYHTKNFSSSIFSVIHETGHALYDQGLPQAWKYQPIGSACSTGVHESQSRLYENVIGRSSEFWNKLFPLMKKTASPHLNAISFDKFMRSINSVSPSKIRIEADEVTYNLHIIIRFQIEEELFSGKLSARELPEVWNKKYDDLLGVKVKNDSEGVMQDTHWASGLYGYFPTYALGNIYTGQISAAIQKSQPDWRAQMSRGNLQPVRNWLRENIYKYGNLHDPAVLMEKATGVSLDINPFISYLNEKYSKLYGF